MNMDCLEIENSLFFVFFYYLKVLGHGEVLEFDTPSVLLSNADSYFVSLVEQTGPAETEYLRTLANRLSSRTTEKKREATIDEEPTPSGNENDPLLA